MKTYLLRGSLVISLLTLTGCNLFRPLMAGHATPSSRTITLVLAGQSNSLNLALYGQPAIVAALQHQMPGVQVHLIPCAVNATAAVYWIPGGQGYENCMSIIQGHSKQGYHVDGVMYWQGEYEGEGPLPSNATNWEMLFMQTVQGFRSDLHSPTLPFFYARLSSYFTYGPGWTTVREQQESVRDPNCFLVNIDDVPTDAYWIPHYPYGTYSQLGKIFGDLAGRYYSGGSL